MPDKSISFFDANCFVGRRGQPQRNEPTDVAGLLGVMDSHRIEEALIHHVDAWGAEAADGNEVLVELTGQTDRLHPCWVVMPHHTGELPEPRELVRQMAQQGVKAVRIFPKRIGPLREFLFGPLLDALAEHRIVTLLDFELAHYTQHIQGIDWDGLCWALGAYPDLPIVLMRVGHSIDRTLLALAPKFDNLYIETSYYVGAGALERLIGVIGAGRMLFGTGMPEYAPGPAITLVTYSGLSQSDKEKVGGGNLRRLLEGVDHS